MSAVGALRDADDAHLVGAAPAFGDEHTPEPKPIKKPSAKRKPKTNHATKKASDELSEMKPVA